MIRIKELISKRFKESCASINNILKKWTVLNAKHQVIKMIQKEQ